MGRLVYHFEDESRPLGKFDGAAETVKFLGRLLLAALTVAFLTGLAWMMASGDSGFFMRIVNQDF
jgi:hypothetical protein